MQLSEMLDKMKSVIPLEDLPVVLASLREDEHIWQTMQDEELFSRVLKFSGQSVDLWNPWVYAVLFLEDQGLSREILSNNSYSIPKKIIKASFEQYQQLITRGEFPTNFEEQVLIALSIRERRKRLGGWRGLGLELGIEFTGNEQLPPAIWKTILAINFASANDRSELITALFENDDLSAVFDWAIHCVFSLPLKNSARAEYLLPELQSLTLDDQLLCLHRLKEQGHEDLAAILGNALTSGLKVLDENQAGTIGKSIQDILNRSEQFRKIGSLYQIAGKAQEADVYFCEAKKGLDLVANGINLQAFNNMQVKSAHADENLMTWLSSGEAGASETENKFESNSYPYTYIEIRRLMKAGMLEDAKHLAGSSFQRLISVMIAQPQLLADVNAHIHPSDIIQTYLDLGLDQEGSQAAEILSSLRPNDVSVLLLKSQALLKTNDLEQAEEALELALSLDHKNPMCHRKFAELLTMQSKWKKALIYRKQIANVLLPESIDDLLEYANCAINAGEYSQAEDACNRVLKATPENSLAIAFLGTVKQNAGSQSEAHELFLKATLIKPDLEMAWINLSNLYYETGQIDKARETLRSAVLGCPESATVAFALAEQYLSDGMVTDALPYLKKASDMHPEKPAVCLRLIQALRLLGRLPEALEIAIESRKIWPIEPDLAFQQGEMLIESGQCKEALEPLEVALSTKRNNPRWNVLYGYDLLDSNQDIVLSDGNGIDHEVLNLAKKYISGVYSSVRDRFSNFLPVHRIIAIFRPANS
ncbi:MAG: hypothetical protein HGA86_02030 [Anaerolineaceae bacterium]|nr:hypothetical protein [Anaerolineaceae bacterium]